jgi:hypothetical protein
MSTVSKSEILEMLAEGKITTAEALKLLDQKTGDAAAAAAAPPSIEELKVEEAALLEQADKVADPIKAKSGEKEDSFSIAITDEDLKQANKGDRPRWLKIRVRTLDTGRNKVNVTLPLGLVNFGLGVARRFGANFDDEPHIESVWEMLKEGQRGELINVEDEEDNEQVLIYLE